MWIQFQRGDNRADGGKALRAITVLISASDFRAAFRRRTVTRVQMKFGQMTNGQAMKAEDHVVCGRRIEVGAQTFSPRLDKSRMVVKRLPESQAIFAT